MNELVLFTGNTLPTLIDAAGDQARNLMSEYRFRMDVCAVTALFDIDPAVLG